MKHDVTLQDDFDLLQEEIARVTATHEVTNFSEEVAPSHLPPSARNSCGRGVGPLGMLLRARVSPAAGPGGGIYPRFSITGLIALLLGIYIYIYQEGAVQ